MFMKLCEIFSKNPEEITPSSNYKKWFKKHPKTGFPKQEVFNYPSNAIYTDECNREIDTSKYIKLIVEGNKLSLCNIYSGDIIFIQHKDNINNRKENPICVFDNGNLGQIAFEGNIDDYSVEEIYEKCLNLKKDKTENDYSLERLKEYIKTLSSDYINHNIIIAFKYKQDIDKYYKEWNIYFDNEYLGDIVYCFGKRN